MSNGTEYIEIGRNIYKADDKSPNKRVKLNFKKTGQVVGNTNNVSTEPIASEALSEKQSENSLHGNSSVNNERDLQSRTVGLQVSLNTIRETAIANPTLVAKVVKVTAIGIIVLPVLAVTSAFTNSNNVDIKQTVSSWFNSLNCKNEEFVKVILQYFNKAICADKDINFLSKIGISGDELTVWLLKDFYYNIRHINVLGNSATVNITSKSNNLYYLLETIATISSKIDVNNTSLEDIYNEVGGSVRDKLNKSLVRTSSIAISLKRISGTWEINDKDSLISNLFVR